MLVMSVDILGKEILKHYSMTLVHIWISPQASYVNRISIHILYNHVPHYLWRKQATRIAAMALLVDPDIPLFFVVEIELQMQQ